MNSIERISEVPVAAAEMIVYQPGGKVITVRASGGSFILEKDILTPGSTASFTLRFIDPALFAATQTGE